MFETIKPPDLLLSTLITFLLNLANVKPTLKLHLLISFTFSGIMNVAAPELFEGVLQRSSVISDIVIRLKNLLKFYTEESHHS